MESINDPNIVSESRTEKPRLVYSIVLESLLVLVIGLAAWGACWDLGYGRVGAVCALVIWVAVMPALEIATVLGFRRGQ